MTFTYELSSVFLEVQKVRILARFFYGELSSRNKKFRQSVERKNRRLLGRIL